LFAEHGVAGTTSARIATTAGMTPAMVHYYFINRQRLLDAITEERLLRAVMSVWAPVSESTERAPELVRGLVQRILRAAELQPWLPSLWLREIVQERGQLRERMLRRLPLAQVETFVATVTAAQRRGEINPAITPRLLVLSMLGLTLLPLATRKSWRRVPLLRDIGREELARHAEALLLQGLSVPRRGAFRQKP
jgi:AcrR family transcriptional regulator